MTPASTPRLRFAVLVCVALGGLALAAPAFARSDSKGSHGTGSSQSGKATSTSTKTTTVTATTPGSIASVSATVTTVQGVVQSVSPSTVAVRQLDGSSVNVPIDKNTKVTLDGKSAKLAEIKPGYVLIATWKTGTPASAVRFLKSS